MSSPFRWDGDHLRAELPGASALFTTRRGGVSEGPYATLNLGLWTEDEPDRVHENRDRTAGLAGIPRGRFAQGRQVHDAGVRVLDGPPGGEPPESDGQVTSAEEVAPIVLVADCLPIALARPGMAGMLHAGWRGLAAGIVEEGVRAFGEPPVAVAIGPAAGPCCYEVGEEVHAAFAELGPRARRGRNLDLKAIAAHRLHAAGVEEVHDAQICTICGDPELWFSHRREGGVTGRQAGVAWRSS